MKEICEEFDELQKKRSSDLRDDTDRSELGCEAQSVDGVEDNEVEVDLKDGTGIMGSDGETVNEEVGDSSSKLERCSQRRGERDYLDLVPSTGGGASDSLSPVKSSDKKGKVLDAAEPKKEIVLKSGSNSSPHPEGAISVDGQRGLSNGHKLKKMGSGSKRSEGGIEVHKSKSASTGSKKEISFEDKIDPEICGVKKAKSLPKTKSHLKVPNDTHRTGVDPVEQSEEKLPGRTKKAQIVLGIASSGTNEVLHPAKKVKHVDARDDSRASVSKNRKGFSPSPITLDSKAVAKSDFKKSTSQVKAENHLTSRSQNVVVPNVSGDETVLPLTKRRRRALEAMSESDIKMEKDPVVRNDVSSSSNVSVVATQLQKKKRAVCLYDDDDDDKPKTPIHGGSATNIKAHVSDDSKSFVANIEKCEKSLDHGKDSTEPLDIHTKESSTLNGSLSPDKCQADDKEQGSHQSDEKGSEGHPQSDEKRLEKEEMSEPEHLSYKEAKQNLISPKKSPHMPSALKPVVEEVKATKPMARVSNPGSLKKVQSVSNKSSVSVPNSSQNQVTTQRNKPVSSTERSKPTPKSHPRINDAAVVREKSTEPGERYVYL